MKPHRRPPLFGSLLATILLAGFALSAQANPSTLKLSVFESLPPHPSMMDVESGAGTASAADISHVGVAIYRYKLADGSIVLVHASRDRRTIFAITHEVGGVSTKIFPHVK